MAAVMGIAFASCEKGGDEEPGVLTLTRTSATLIEGQTRDVQASYGGEDVTASATWTSSDEAVATVSAGTITAVGEGSATITCEYSGATATVQVTVGAGTAGVADLLQGSEYILIQLGETAYGQIEDKVICDLRSNGAFDDAGNLTEGATRVYYVWNVATEAADAPQSGMNCFGQSDGWFSIAAANPTPDGGWGNICGGLGIQATDTELPKLKLTDKHVFAIALKGKYTPANNLVIRLYDADGKEHDMITVTESTGANKDGNWQVYTISVPQMIQAGVDLTNGVNISTLKDVYYAFAYVAAGAGSRVDIDAAMFYVPAE